MNKIIEIGKAWTNVVAGSKETKSLAEERMLICQECPNKEHSRYLNIDICGICKCPLLGKVHSPVNSCPAYKWKR